MEDIAQVDMSARTYRDPDWMLCSVVHFRINSCRRYSWCPKIATSVSAKDVFNVYFARNDNSRNSRSADICGPQHKSGSYVHFGYDFFSCVLRCTQHNIRELNIMLFLTTLVSQQLCTISCQKKIKIKIYWCVSLFRNLTLSHML